MTTRNPNENSGRQAKVRPLSPLFSWRSAIAESGLPHTARLVALTLSLHMNERGGSAFPSVAMIGDEAGLHRRTVIRMLKLLRETGWLDMTPGGGRGRANVYTATAPVDDPGENEEKGSHTATVFAKRVTLSSVKGGPVPPQDVKEDVKPSPGRDRVSPDPLVCPEPHCQMTFRTERKRDEHLYVVHAGPEPAHYREMVG